MGTAMPPVTTDEALKNKPQDRVQPADKAKSTVRLSRQISKMIAWTCFTVLATALIWAVGWSSRRLSSFLHGAQVSAAELKQTLAQGWQQTPDNTAGYKNLLILGLDQLAGRGDSSALTDTMILLSLDFKTGHIRTLSLPRDLWSQAYQTKINALYTYGLERDPTQPTAFPKQVIENMTGLTIHHTLTISMAELATMVDLLGGVEVKIEEGFTDEEFPRPEVDVTTVTDPELLYETVTFATGTEVMTGQRALKYMRSRHGDNEQNTDLSRGYRQQAVIQGLVHKFLQPKTWLQTETMGQLYRYYLDHFSTAFPATELVATAKYLWPVRQNLAFQFEHLTVYPDEPEGTIEHPPQSDYDGQWIYVIRDPEQFKQTVQSKLLEN